MASTPLRNLRAADDVWLPAMRRARREGTNLTAVLVEFLRQYGAGQAPPPPND
jgi:hypothetical protein